MHLIFRCLCLICFFSLTASDRATIHKELQALVSSFESKGKMGIHVVSLDDDKILFESSSKELFLPASSVKLFVAGAALKILGPSFSFKTEVLTNGILEKGIVIGDVYVQGSGDPSLTDKDFKELIFQLKLKNIEEIRGDLIFDASEFDEMSFGPGWMWSEANHLSHIPIEGLMINQGLVDVWIKPAEVAMMSPFVQIEPQISGLLVENFAIMAKIDPFKSSLEVKKKQVKNKDVLTVEGVMSLSSSPMKFQVPVKHSLLYAATEFSLRLKKSQIKHQGKIRFAKNSDAKLVLAKHYSDSLFNLTRHMLKTNNDLYANCFLKKIGRVSYGKPGTWPNGCQTVRDFLGRVLNQSFDGLVLLDGSGESCYNRVCPKMTTVFLQELYHRFVFAPEFMACMQLSGVDGLFKKRFRQKRLYSKIRGISGSIKGTSFLCGYVMTQDEQCLAFSVMTSDVSSHDSQLQESVEDKICDCLVQYSKEN